MGCLVGSGNWARRSGRSELLEHAGTAGCRNGIPVKSSAAASASVGGHVGAVGEPTCHGGGARGGDVGAKGEPTPPSDGGHVGAEGEPTCHGGGGRGGDVGAKGEPTSIRSGGDAGERGSGGDKGGVCSAPSSWMTAEAAPGLYNFFRFLALVSMVEDGDAGLQLGAATNAVGAAGAVGAEAAAAPRLEAAWAAAWA